MNIVHIATDASFTDGFGYQENLLPKYQQKMGHSVTLIVQNKTRSSGKLADAECGTFCSKDGFQVRFKKPYYGKLPKIGRLFKSLDVYEDLMDLKPDMVFYHGLISSTIFQVTRYKRLVNQKLVIVQDNHLDYNIGFPKKKNLRQWIIVLKDRLVYRLNNKFISKVYGVTPWRKAYAENVYCVPSNKTDVLIMGADDEYLKFESKTSIRKEIREKYNITNEDFLIVTGGKIDEKKKIDLLMQAVVNENNVKLLIFGSVADDVKEKFEDILKDNKNIVYVGWINGFDVYNYFFAADLVIFPGQHSVLWEQACAAKVPCVFEKWEGMDHVDNGGNCDFVSNVSVESLKKKISELLFSAKYYKMKTIAESDKTDIFLYSKIAKKSLECINNV